MIHSPPQQLFDNIVIGFSINLVYLAKSNKGNKKIFPFIIGILAV